MTFLLLKGLFYNMKDVRMEVETTKIEFKNSPKVKILFF